MIARDTSTPDSRSSVPWALTGIQDAFDFYVDAWQRSVLMLDVLQKRSVRYETHAAKPAPHVLKFGCELIADGRELERPVNYVLARVTPPKGVRIDDRKRPFVVVDPRAGHGPGIGGFKPDSEIGVAFKAGHPCYIIGFLPEPVAGQTIEDIANAEATFLERVIALHPRAEGKPAVIGNCQAGWAVALLAALRPELFGPIIIAGAPLSYWAGKHGTNPMRYTAGLLGGSWLATLAGDLGNGRFDGAWLVSNFEGMNPANTLWSKQYNLYSNIDNEAARYLDFEEWWGAHVLLNADEIQFITDELFIGNKLAVGDLRTSDGETIDLRNIKSPILVFCSKADNITPPQQALGWILDLYKSVDDLRAHGQTIVYAIHETVGHLGIFVSGSVANKEHDEFASNIDLIDVLPPGLYEAVLLPKDPEQPTADLIAGDYLVRFESRSLDDIRALGFNDEADDRKFATVSRVSDINLGLYRTFMQPWIQGFTTETLAEWSRRMHPLRIQYEIFSDSNPFLRSMTAVADHVRNRRQPISTDNLFWRGQEVFSDWVATTLGMYGNIRDNMLECMFDAAYGSPLLQTLAGLNGATQRQRPGSSAAHAALVGRRIEDIKKELAEGGPREAAIRCLLYIRMPDGTVDERGFNFLRLIRKDAGKDLSLSEFKHQLRKQFLLLLLDERRAVKAIPEMFDRDPDLAVKMRDTLRRLIDVVGLQSDEAKARLAEVEQLLGGDSHASSLQKNNRKRAPAAALRGPRDPSVRSKHH